jgi:hypothetical protein
MAFKIAQERILASRHRHSTDALHQTYRVYEALQSVLDGKGVPPEEVLSIAGLSAMREARLAAEEALAEMKDEGVKVTAELRDEVLAYSFNIHQDRWPELSLTGKRLDRSKSAAASPRPTDGEIKGVGAAVVADSNSGGDLRDHAALDKGHDIAPSIENPPADPKAQ